MTDEDAQHAMKVELTGNGKDKLALLENAAMDGMFDGWKEGIFAIGTFGFDPTLLKDFVYEDEASLCDINREELFVDDDDDGGDHEKEMEFPLVFKACNHGFFHDLKDEHSQRDEIPKPDDHEEGVEDTDRLKMGKKDGERITLADLFLADSEKNLLKNKKSVDEDHVKVKVQNNTTEFDTKHSSSDDRVCLISKKKLIKDDATRPIKKINRVSLYFSNYS